jgi:hypothetical protein
MTGFANYTKDDSGDDQQWIKTVTTAEDAIASDAGVDNGADPPVPIGIDVSKDTRCTLMLKATSTTAFTVKVFLYNLAADLWVEDTESAITGTTADLVRELRVAGVNRVAVRVTAITGTSVKRVLSTFRE